MRVLVACEESQRVCLAFRERGHEAFSCDLIPCSGGHPEFHIQDDVLNHLHDGWDMLIGFPPCTYFSCAGAGSMFPSGKLNQERFQIMLKFRDLFLALYNAPVPKICLENPKYMRVCDLPLHSQVIQPWYFGDPYTKRTYLWEKGLPPLLPTDVVQPIFDCSDDWFMKGGVDRQKNRSKTFPGVALAMSLQWG